MKSHQNELRNEPEAWRAASERLLNTLTVIERGLFSASDVERFDAELSAMMIAGFAFENAFKARFLSLGGVLYQNGKQTDFRDHAFTKWASEHSVPMSESERDALDKAEFFCVAWGRYPAHNKREKERPFETWGWSDIEQLRSLVRRLLNESMASNIKINKIMPSDPVHG